MYNFTGSLTNNGTNNLLTLLTAAGYNGPAIVQGQALLYNASGSVVAYAHNTDSNVQLPGTRQVESTPVLGTITAAGNAVFTITASGLAGSPLAVNVPVTVGMSDRNKALSAVNALSSNAAIADFFDVGITDPKTLKLTKKTVAANDGTLNIAITDPNSTGITTDATSDHTTAGALVTTTGMPFGGGATSPSTSVTLKQGTDLSTTWLHTPSSIVITAEVQG